MSVDPRFVASLFEPTDLVEVRLIPKPRSLFCQAGGLVNLDEQLQSANDGGQNVYVGANPRKRRGRRAKDVALARCLFADLDNVGVDAGMRRVREAELPEPTCTVNSGHGVHFYWRLSNPIHDLEKWTTSQRQLIRMLDSDPVIHDPPRIMRMPGYRNHKDPPADCVVVDADPQRRYELRQLIPPNDDQESTVEYWFRAAVRRAVPGNRNEIGLWLACQLRDAGLDQPAVEAVLRRYSEHMADDYTEDEAVATARSAFTRPARETAHESPRRGAPEDPELIPLEDRAAPEIAADVLPAWAREYATGLSLSKEVPLALPVLLELAAMASCVQRAFEVEVENGFTEPLCLYVAPSLESGERKTAVHRPVVRPLFRFQKQLRDAAEVELRSVNIKRRLIEKQINVLEKQHERGEPEDRCELERQIIELTGQLPPEPATPQLIVEDFTEAALSIALEGNGESVLVTSDEGGLFDNLSGRHSAISEIDLFLKAHAGSPHTVNRVGRDNVFLIRPLVSVAICPQPAVLAGLSRKDGFLGRGLTARFLWAVPRSRLGHRRLDPASVSVSVSQTYEDNLLAMAQLGHDHSGNPARISLDDDAYAAWKAFERDIEPRLGPNGDLLQIRAWASKLSGAVARIAGVCHVGEHLNRAAATPISEDQMRRAVETGRSLIPHSVSAHRLMSGTGFTAAEAVVRHYDTVGWPAHVQTLTEWWRPVRKFVGETSRAFEPLARILVDHGYLIPVHVGGPGRWGQHYRANQRLSGIHRTSSESAV